MCESKDNRNSSLELLRIIAMILIVVHHYAVHSGFIYEYQPFTASKLIMQTLSIFGKVGVNIFILISTYFLCSQTECKYKKWLKYF